MHYQGPLRFQMLGVGLSSGAVWVQFRCWFWVSFVVLKASSLRVRCGSNEMPAPTRRNSVSI